ncbi:hypothetical protein DXG03_007684 [Asterophora parasitica]|uniref:Uncharacterized protein n=1 Tax=Asterophora parasitica TaxID=117018 RepID=A0A9P7KEF3_9AGAR|nr:hypothetical protein DXG03_007684 [Asterophora parasitica]
MASIASSSNAAAAVTPQSDSRVEAGPLPSKRGEIGYVEGAEVAEETRSSSSEEALPARHPADREESPATNASATAPDANHPSASTATLVSTTSTLVSSESENAISKKQRVLFFFKSKKITTFLGFSLKTFLLFLLQAALIGGTIAGWVLIVKHSSKIIASASPDGFNITSIFIHVIFGVALLAQFLFIERRVFRLRAERYSYLHPGQILPSSRHRRVADPSIAFSPWNRPPLPTYAAALAQSGVGTGDAEDHLIAAPPPPAYGNTRGSTLLLAGFLRNSLRAQRPVSGQSNQRPVSRQSQMTQRDERPMSYVSRDDQWEEIQDAQRARQLEQTLSRLERPSSRVRP